MKPQKQKNRHDPANRVWGDCYRTCIAVVFGLDRDEVPHFMDEGRADGEAKKLCDPWLAARGYLQVDIPWADDPGPVLKRMGETNPGLIYLLAGFSRTGCNHSVVCQGGEIVCDPSLNDSGIVGRCDDGYTWVTIFCPISYAK